MAARPAHSNYSVNQDELGTNISELAVVFLWPHSETLPEVEPDIRSSEKATFEVDCNVCYGRSLFFVMSSFPNGSIYIYKLAIIVTVRQTTLFPIQDA